MDPDVVPYPELGKIEARSGSETGINSFGSKTLQKVDNKSYFRTGPPVASMVITTLLLCWPRHPTPSSPWPLLCEAKYPKLCHLWPHLPPGCQCTPRPHPTVHASARQMGPLLSAPGSSQNLVKINNISIFFYLNQGKNEKTQKNSHKKL